MHLLNREVQLLFVKTRLKVKCKKNRRNEWLLFASLSTPWLFDRLIFKDFFKSCIVGGV